jgi:hypothetical protein
MAKRFTDSTKWNDDWFSNLKNDEKLAWIYILDTCDHAGIWKKNLRLLNFQIGSNFVDDDLHIIFAGKFIEINDKWFIPNFIKFQYGKTFLTSNTAAVKSARELLLDIGFIQLDNKGLYNYIKELPNPYLTLKEPLDKGYDTLKDKDKDKEEDKDKFQDIDKDKVQDEFKSKVEDKVKRTTNQIRQDLNVIYMDVPNWESKLYASGIDEFVVETNSYTYEEVELLREFLQS